MPMETSADQPEYLCTTLLTVKFHKTTALDGKTPARSAAHF